MLKLSSIPIISLVDIFNGCIYYDGDYTVELLNDNEILVTDTQFNKKYIVDSLLVNNFYESEV